MLTRARHMFGRAVRESGQALDRLGLTVLENEIFRDTLSRHRPIMNLYDKRPKVSTNTFVAPNASVIGDVKMFDGASVWYGAVVRGDRNSVVIGSNSNVQDRAVVHTSEELQSGFPASVTIGHHVTIGHGAVLNSCTVEDEALIGMGAIVMEGAVVESRAMLAAGAVVGPGKRIPSGQLWAGNPAVFVRELTEEEQEGLKKQAESYTALAKEHADEFSEFGTAYLESERLAGKH